MLHQEAFVFIRESDLSRLWIENGRRDTMAETKWIEFVKQAPMKNGKAEGYIPESEKRLKKKLL